MKTTEEKQPRFICDDNLGKLARYLRVGGFDTVFEKEIDNSRLIQISLDDKRYILTRDHRLIERRLVRYYFLIENDLWPDQVKAVINHFEIEFNRTQMFTRCLEDNALIILVEKEAIQHLVYPYTYEHHDDFRQCPQCQRVYWSGDHIKAIIDRLESAGISIKD
jgi:uncharacterized protein with PIN domain